MADYPRVEFVAAIGTWAFEGEAYIDTGFDGGLIIPAALQEDVLAEPAFNPVRLADNSIQVAPHWPARVELEGREFHTEAIGLGVRFLLGREVLDQLEVCFEFGRTARLRFRDEDG
jgi:predicted aspartyl protease